MLRRSTSRWSTNNPAPSSFNPFFAAECHGHGWLAIKLTILGDASLSSNTCLRLQSIWSLQCSNGTVWYGRFGELYGIRWIAKYGTSCSTNIRNSRFFYLKKYLKIEFLGQIAIRTRIINELVSSEFTYLTLLRDISKFWIEPLSKILSKQDMKTIFINLTKIKEIHESFYEDVKKESEKQFESRKISGKRILKFEIFEFFL